MNAPCQIQPAPPPSRQHGAALRGPTGPTRGIFNPGFGFACRGRRENGGAVRALAGSCVTFKGPRDEFHGSPRLSGSPPVRLSAGRGFLFRVSVSSDPLPKPSGSALHAAAPLAVPPPPRPPTRPAPDPRSAPCGERVGAASPLPAPIPGSVLCLLSVTSGFGNPPSRIPPSFPFGGFANPAFWGMSFAPIGCTVTFCGDRGGTEWLRASGHLPGGHRAPGVALDPPQPIPRLLRPVGGTGTGAPKGSQVPDVPSPSLVLRMAPRWVQHRALRVSSVPSPSLDGGLWGGTGVGSQMGSRSAQRPLSIAGHTGPPGAVCRVPPGAVCRSPPALLAPPGPVPR